MPIFDSVFDFFRSSNPLILIIAGLILLAAFYILFRVAVGMLTRIIAVGCSLIILVAMIWIVLRFVL